MADDKDGTDKPAFGVFPHMKATRSKQDREAAKNVPVDLVRGALSGALGMPGDIESLARIPYDYMRSPTMSELVSGKQPSKTFFPTSEEVEKQIPFGSDAPVSRAATGLGQLVGGFYTGPGAPIRALTAVPGALAHGAGEFAKAAASAGPHVIKQKGGNWVEGAVEKWLGKFQRGDEVDSWIKSNLANYIKKQMSTPEDPVRELAERGITHAKMPEHYLDPQAMREMGGFPPEGLAKSPQAKEWERASDFMMDPIYAERVQSSRKQGKKMLEAIDEESRVKQDLDNRYAYLLRDTTNLSPEQRSRLVFQTPHEDMARALGMPDELSAIKEKYIQARQGFEPEMARIGEDNPWIEKLPPASLIHRLQKTGDTLGFDHIIDVMRADIASGRLRPEQLNKVSMKQAVERTHEYDQQMIAKAKEAQIAAREGLPVYKEYPEGFRWIELNRPGTFAAESDAMGHSVRGYEPPKSHEDWIPESGDEGSRSYGHGGWEAIKSGKAKVYSLVDPKGEPHVTVEVKAPERMSFSDAKSELDKMSNLDENEKIEALFKNGFIDEAGNPLPDEPPRITQIKGKGNLKPHESYLPFVQDFVKSGNWSDVGDIRNAGLFKVTPGQRLPGFSQEMEPGYYTLDDFKRIAAEKEMPQEIQDVWFQKLQRGFAHGGAVHISDNPDVQMGEVMNPLFMDEGGAAFGQYTTGKKYQGARQRAQEADVNLLKDPKTYAAIQSFMGTPPDDSLKPTEVKRPEALGLSQALQSIHEFASKPFGHPNPPGEILSGLIGIPALAKTLERLGYGEPLFTGSGMTLKPKDETIDALMAVAPLTKSLVPGAKAIAGQLAPKAGQALEDYMFRRGLAIPVAESGVTSTGIPKGITYETGQEGPFYRVRPNLPEAAGRQNRGTKEGIGGSSSTSGTLGVDVPAPITDEAVQQTLNQPNNFVKLVADEYSRKNAVGPYSLPQIPESSILKQSPIGRVFGLASTDDPAYKSVVFNQYAKKYPKIVERSGAQNYDQLLEASYRQLAKETEQQFRVLPINMSYHRAGEGNYENSKELLRDVYGNRHMYVYQGGDPHDFLNVVDPSTGLNTNEMFRAVHDFFGHAIHGNQFGPKGEEVAWAAHSKMFSPLARIAMTSETRGQNSFVNYTPLNAELKSKINQLNAQAYEARRRGQTGMLDEINKDLSEAWQQFQFAPQKSVILPPEFLDLNYKGGMPGYLKSLIKPEPGTTVESKLTHYSTRPELTETDPRMYGTGIKGEEMSRLQDTPGAVMDRTYFYAGEPGSVTPEVGLGPYRYAGESSGLYDVSKDPLKFRALAAETQRNPYTSNVNPGMVFGNPFTDVERLIKEYGYEGLLNPNLSKPTAVMFNPVPVKRYADGGSVHISDDPNVQRLELQAGGPVLRALSKLMRAPAKTEQEIKAIAERIAPQVTERGAQSSGVDLSGALKPSQAPVRGQTSRELQKAQKQQLTDEQKELFDSLRQSNPSFAEAAKFMTPQEVVKIISSPSGVKQIENLLSVLPSAKELSSVAKAGSPKLGWYRASTQAIIDVFGVEDAPRFASLLASLSPQTSVEMNLLNSLNTWKNWNAAGRPTNPDEIRRVLGQSVSGTKGDQSVLEAWSNNAIRSLSAPDPTKVTLSGPKVDSFFKNLADDVYKVTNDAWMASGLGVGQELFSGSPTALQIARGDPGLTPGYIGTSARMRQAGQMAGMLPSEAQETAWSLFMPMYETAKAQGIPAREVLQRGLLTPDVIRGTPDFASLLAQGKYGDILRSAGYEDQLSKLRPTPFSQKAPELSISEQRDLEQAARRLENLKELRGAESRARTISLPSGEEPQKAFAYATYETTPGRGTGHLEGIIDEPIGTRQHFSSKVAGVFKDPQGRDVLQGSLGLNPISTRSMTGAYRPEGEIPYQGTLRYPSTGRHPMETNPGFASGIEVPVTKSGDIPERFKKKLTAAEAARGYMTAQRGSPWNAQVPFEGGESMFVSLDKKADPNRIGMLSSLANNSASFADTGAGTAVLNWAKPLTQAERDYIELALGGKGIETKNISDYVDFGREFESGYGSGEATKKLLGIVDKLPQSDQRALSEAMKKPSGELADIYEKASETRKEPIREDLVRGLRIINRAGLPGLAAALAAGEALAEEKPTPPLGR